MKIIEQFFGRTLKNLRLKSTGKFNANDVNFFQNSYAKPINCLRPGRTAISDIDQSLIWMIFGLLAFGLVMVYSASIAITDAPKFASYQRTHFVVRHIVSILIGLSVGMLVFRIPLRVWDRNALKLFLFALFLLFIVLLPFIGKGVNGARRWISLAFINIQPSEIMKLAVTIYAANYLVRKQALMHSFRRGFLPMAVAVSLVGVLLLLEPDMGSFMVIAMIAMSMLFLGNVNGRLFSGLVLTTLATFTLIIWLSPWRRERIFAYLDPWNEAYVQDKAYQLTHSLIALGRGELFGVGLGNSVEKLNYLPEAHTDFILAVIGEELGFIGVFAVIVAFYWLVRRSFEIGRQALALDRTFAGLVAKGVGLWLGAQSFINIGVSLGLLPTKGLTLPLVSYGGSGILINCVALAILLRVDYENRILMRGGQI